jgi:ferric-dicitrate binding protein FerR (iron transport regulator)
MMAFVACCDSNMRHCNEFVFTVSDQGTRLAFTATDEIRLERGTLYVDAGPDAVAAGRLAVVTPTGSVRHVGTQYEVRVLESGLRLRVREGRVEWRSNAGRIERSLGGEQLIIGRDGRVERQSATRYGESWDWISAATPAIAIEGRPLGEFLAWAARELGRELQYSSPAVAGEAAGVILHGSIAGLTPAQALDTVLATTRVRAIVQGDHIVVGGPGAASPTVD